MTSPLTGQRSRSELIAELFERHAAGLFAYCHDQLGETASAADAVVAVFTTAPAAADPPSRAMLYALARREIYRRDVSYALPAVDSVADPATALIERVFRDIRPHQREVLLLSEVCGLTPPELSLVLDVAVDTAGELAAGAKRRFTQTLATAVAAARSAPFVPPSVAEVYDAIGVAPVADVLARLPWRHPSASVRNRVLAALPYEEPGDPAATGTGQVADESGAQPGAQSGAQSGGLVTKRLWPTTPTWPLPLSDPDQVTNTCVVKTEALTPQEPRRRAKHEATTEPMPRLRGALLNSLTEGRLRRKRATRPEPRSQETRPHETPAREAQALKAQALESRAQGTSAQESPAQEAFAAPVEQRTPPRFPSQALSDALSQAPSQASTPPRPQSQASSQPPGSQPPGSGLPESASGVPVAGFGVPESARSAGHAGHGGSVGAEGPATDSSAVEWFKAGSFEADRFEAEGFEAERFKADRFEADRFEAERFDAFRPADPFDAFAPASPPGVARPADPPPAPAVFADDPQRQTPGERRDFDAFAPAGPLPPGESFDAFAPPSSLPPDESFDAFTPPGPATASTPAEPFEAAHTLLFETLRSAEPFDAFAAPAEAPARPAGEPAAQPASDVTADAAAGPDSRLVTEAASPPEASGPTEAFRPAESTAIPQTVFPEAAFPEAAFPQAVSPETRFPQAEFPETRFPQAEFPEFPEAEFPEFPQVEEQVKHPVGGYPAAFPEDDAPGTPEPNSAPVTNGAPEAGGEQAVDAPAAKADVLDPVPDPAVTPAAASAGASAAPAAVPAAVPAASPVAPARKDGKRPAKKHTTKKQTAKKQTTTKNPGSAGNAEATGVRPAGKGPRKKSDRHYDWLWEVVGFLICLIIALVVFFTVPTIVTH
ncbi:RNA polymerase sigma factor [Microbispora sp. H10885]|uniref:RNA polymerase sigma factor n=1 Tax=Microbispora sp. H10885 TaxID=2729110 RepID=UPI001600D7CF|nr:hypothetical protein [Microbispora sp. H10885]